jgi:hypothetical protein
MSDELTEFEVKLLESIKNITGYGLSKYFIQNIRKIMPPTCTENERKFLDRVREGNLYTSESKDSVVKSFIVFGNPENECSIIMQSDFPGINLKELVNE